MEVRSTKVPPPVSLPPEVVPSGDPNHRHSPEWHRVLGWRALWGPPAHGPQLRTPSGGPSPRLDRVLAAVGLRHPGILMQLTGHQGSSRHRDPMNGHPIITRWLLATVLPPESLVDA